MTNGATIAIAALAGTVLGIAALDGRFGLAIKLWAVKTANAARGNGFVANLGSIPGYY